MFTVIIAFIMLIVGLVTGYTMQPKVSRKISYKKRGIAAKKRAQVKRQAKTQPRADNKVGQPAKDTYLSPTPPSTLN